MRRFVLCLSSLMAVFALGVVAACQSEDAGEPSGELTTAPPAAPESTEDEAPDPAPAKRLLRAPRDCTGPAPRLTSFGDYGNLAGKAPVWGGFYAAFDGTGQRYRIERGAPRTSHGCRVKVLWVVEADLEQPARVQARELRTGAALWFEIGEGGGGTAPVGVLDPAGGGAPATASGYREFPSYVYVPRAGCYELEATWSRGSWRLVFGLGR